jgi:hypothetical protein
MADLALRRWCGSLTLSSPESVPSLFGLWTWLTGLAGLLLLAMVFQGPGRALAQAFDLRGHFAVFGAAAQRLRRSGRLLAAVVGFTVLSWTGAQTLSFQHDTGRTDVLLLTRARGLGELAVEQGVFAALTPLRDVAGLASNLPLLVVGAMLVFRASAEAWGGGPPSWAVARRPKLSGWANVAWLCASIVVLYRLIAMGTGASDLPVGGCLFVEVVVIPGVMAVSDGLLLGWLLVELRAAGFDDPTGDAFDARGAVGLLPASVLACFAVLPARYLAVGGWLTFWYYLQGSSAQTANPLAPWARWLLGPGVAESQGAALLFVGLVGPVAWCRGGVRGALHGYARLLTEQGGRLALTVAAAGLAAGAVAAPAYVALLSLPASSWILSAADGYAHYATLPVGLWTLSALVELGERSLPVAVLATVPVETASVSA